MELRSHYRSRFAGISASPRTTNACDTYRVIPLIAALVVPSLLVVTKFGGQSGALAYVVVASVALWWWLRRLPLPPRADRAVCGALLGVIVLAFAVGYPRVNVHTPFSGSDDDDAYNVGVQALLAGRSPYAERTYLGNELHQLPGALIAAAPFVVLGTSALQNLFWLPLFFYVGRQYSRTRAVGLAVAALLLSPVVLHQIVTGTGHIANTIYVVLALWWLMRHPTSDVAAVLWGIAITSRANFIVLMPLAIGWVMRVAGWRRALRTALFAGGTVAALVLPFYLYGAGEFGPFVAANRVTQFDDALPHAGALMVAAMALVSVWGAWRASSAADLLRVGALVQAIPVLSGAAIGFVAWQQLDVAFLAYGVFASWFVFMAWIVDGPA